MKNFKHVYILVSELDPDRHYTGLKEELQGRLKSHNAGKVPHTAKHKP